MKLNRIILQGFMRFKGSYDVTFPQNQVTLIVGENGAGKTSILDALCVSLYGKTLRTSGKATSGYLCINDLVNHDCNKATIRVEFENHGHNYVVTRTITKNGTDGEVYQDGDSKAVGRGVYDFVRSQAIGLDWEGFRKSTIVLQGEMGSLTDLDPRPRKDAFIKLFGLDKYFEYEAIAQKKGQDKEKEISTFNKADELLKNDIQKIPAIRLDLRRLNRTVISLQNKKAKLAITLEQKRTRKDSLENDHGQFIQLKTKIEAIDSQMQKEIESRGRAEKELAKLISLRKEFPKLSKTYKQYALLDQQLMALKPIKLKYDAAGQKVLTLSNTLSNKQQGLPDVLTDIENAQGYIRDLKKQIPTQKAINAVTNALAKARKGEKELGEQVTTLQAEIKQIKASTKDLTENMGEVKGKEACPVCLQKISNPHDILTHYKDEISRLSEERKSKEELLGSTQKNLQLKSAEVKTLAAKEQEIIKKAAKKNELAKETNRLSSLREKRKRLLSEIMGLKEETRLKAVEQKKLGFLPATYDTLDHKLVQLRQQKVVERFSNAETEIKRIPSVQNTITDHNERVRGLTETSLQHKEQKKKLGRVESLYAMAKSQFDAASALYNTTDKTLATEVTNKANQERQLNDLVEKEAKLRENEERIATLREEIETMADLQNIFKNIPENILRRLRPFVEKEGTDIIADLSNAEITALNIQEDTLNVAATSNGEIRPIHYFSGGQKTRINMALRVAIARILSKLPQTEEHSFVTMHTLFIDEGDFGNLDDEGIHEAIAVIRNLTKEFDRVILVSHVDEIREIFHGYTVEAVKTSDSESALKTFGMPESGPIAV